MHPEASRTSSSRIRVVAVLLSASTGLLGTQLNAEPAPFTLELVDTHGGEFSSITVNKLGYARISYYTGSGTGGFLRYAERRCEGWSAMVIDPDFLQGGYTPIALNAAGEPRISYRDGANDNLKYAERTAGDWNRYYVDGADGFDAGAYTSLALDANGQPRISHYDADFNNLKYSERIGGAWFNYYVDGFDGVNAGTYTSLALDTAGNPHVSYYDETHGNLKHAVRSGGNWNFEVVDGPPGVSVGAFTSIKLFGNAPRISYRDETNGDLKYAEKNGALWTISTVDSDGRVGGFSSLALDVNGNPHIAYFDATRTAVKYAARTNGIWAIQTVDSVGVVGEYASIALDPGGFVHISYYDAVAEDLRYATNRVFNCTRRGGKERVAPGPESRDPVTQGIPTAIRLRSANPTDGAVEVDYALPSAGVAVLRIYDAAGRVVAQLVDEPQGAGRYQTQSMLGTKPRVPAGVYYLRLTLDGRPIGQRSFVVLR